MTIKVFGDEAKKIDEGDEFKAVKYSVEGHNVVEFVPLEAFCNECGKFLKRIDIGHDDYDYECPKCEGCFNDS